MCTGKEKGVHYFAKSTCWYFFKCSLVFNVHEYILLITNEAINTYQNKRAFYIICLDSIFSQ